MDHIKEVTSQLKTNAGLTEELRKAPVSCYFELGPVSGEYLYNYFSHFIGTLGGPVKFHQYFDFKHLLNLGDSIILNLNEKLICSDDANLHVLLARGAVLPNADSNKSKPKEFHRLSALHGYAINDLPAGLPNIWDDSNLVKLKAYLELAPAGGNVRHGIFPDWIWHMVRLRKTYFKAISGGN